jgi:hypothetical protein
MTSLAQATLALGSLGLVWSPVDISDREVIADAPKYTPEEIRQESARYFPPTELLRRRWRACAGGTTNRRLTRAGESVASPWS